MIISYNWLNSLLKGKLPKVKELSDKIVLHAFEVELPVKHDDDYALEIKILPDRGSDALSHFGIARECSAIFNLPLDDLKVELKEDKNTEIDKFLSVEVKDKDCKRYSARVLTGIEVKESPKWIQDRLKVCGISPINNVVDVTNYVMLELGQPLHAFDYEKLSENKKIIIDKLKKSEKFITLSEQEVVLDKDTLTISDEEDVLVIAGIKGGKKAEISKNTKAIVLESANFKGSLISKTSKKLKIRTDSSYRFEHNIDSNLTVLALDRAANLIQEIAGATILKGVIDIYPKKEKLTRIFLHLDYLKNLLGIDVDLKDVRKILRSLEIEILKEEKDKIELLIPSFRKDIVAQENIIEEIGRIYGYDKINSVIPVSEEAIKRNSNVDFANNLRLIFKEFGFSEVYNYPFIGKEDKENFNFNKLIEIENPITVDSEYLTPSLIPNLIKNLKLNLKYEKDVKIYEIGKGFKKNGVFGEKRYISGVSSKSFQNIKGYLEELFESFGIKNIEFITNEKESFFSKKKSAIIKINKREVGTIGYLSSNVLESLGLDLDPVLFELDFEVFESEIKKDKKYTFISSYPIAIRDITVIVKKDTFVGEVLKSIKSLDSKLIKEIELVDIYNSDLNKSVTFRIYMQAKDRGLENEEINKIQNKIISNLIQNPEWEVKK
ncbi:MAG: phenylalanine--tRNA ligase subunit beta [Candidatus Pacebacteria bacterium]|nr:phenylalanine--tRNA ligase subunit beta [Candidatus Paceibacterota bacterium]